MRRVCDQQGFAWAVLLFWKQTFALMIGVVSWTLEVSLKLVVWVFFPFFFLPPTESQLHFVWAPG